MITCSAINNKMNQSRLKYYLVSFSIGLILISSFLSCKTHLGLGGKNVEQVTACDTTKLELGFEASTEEVIWLSENEDKCVRINEFFHMFDYSEDSIEYMRGFVKHKLKNEEFKL